MGGELKPKYKRILLKISGEALAEGCESGIYNYDFLHNVCNAVKECVDIGVQVGIVVGGGNIWRGCQGSEMDRTTADHMGMLATTINALAIKDALEQTGVPTRVMTAISMQEIAEPYIRNKAIHHLEHGRAVIFGCGIGSPFFSTDTAAVLRGAEIHADIVMMAKNVDGIYTADPKKDKNAVKLDEISYSDILSNELKVVDSTAASFGRDNRLPLLLFGINDPQNILRAVTGGNVGTRVIEK